MSTDDVPDGYQRVWAPTREIQPDWELVDPADSRPCRYVVGPGKTTCKEPSVARLNRRLRNQSGFSACWWHYCGRHLYGQRISGGQLERLILREIPADEHDDLGQAWDHIAAAQQQNAEADFLNLRGTRPADKERAALLATQADQNTRDALSLLRQHLGLGSEL